MKNIIIGITTTLVISCNSDDTKLPKQNNSLFWNTIKLKMSKSILKSNVNNLSEKESDSIIWNYSQSFSLDIINKCSDTTYFINYFKAPNFGFTVYQSEILKVYNISLDSSKLEIEKIYLGHGSLKELYTENNNLAQGFIKNCP